MDYVELELTREQLNVLGKFLVGYCLDGELNPDITNDEAMVLIEATNKVTAQLVRLGN